MHKLSIIHYPLSIIFRTFAASINKTMRKVIGIGETVLDIIFKNDLPIGAVPGGSVFNGIISLGRSGVPASFISETGNDRVGQRIISFARENGVNADNIAVYPESKSPVSLAFLNEKNDADYIFYKDHPRDQMDFVYPDIQPDDIVMFGSYYAVNPVIRPQMAAFLDHARNNGAIIYYDVNFRASHKHEVMKLTPNILENLEYADIVRGSSEDFEILFHKTDAAAIYRSEIMFYTHKFIYTQAANPIELFGDGGFHKQYPITPIETVSTIGAGDNFNAGFLFGLIRDGITREQLEQGLTEQQWDRLITSGQQFSADVCGSLQNYVSPVFGEARKKEL